MKRTGPVLLSWLAYNNDPFERQRDTRNFKLIDGTLVPGPTLSLLFDESSPYRGLINDVVFLVRSDPLELNVAEETTQAVKNRDPNIVVHRDEWSAEDPTDHHSIFKYLEHILPTIRARFAGRELIIHISPGTPSMQTIWVLMAETGYIGPPFKVVKSYRQNEWKGNHSVVPVEIGIESFYKRWQQMRPREIPSEEASIGWDRSKFASEGLIRLFEKAERFAQLNVPILIMGERGTGKTTLAGWIRSKSPFCRPELDSCWPSVVCGQYSSETMRSELFGHNRGAFTGADQEKKGLLATANKDTLFLDEVADVSPEIQRLLIRALEEKKFYPLGKNIPLKSDFRLITATNKTFSELREILDRDFLDRISYFKLTFPPLREMREDIPWLWRQVFALAARKCGTDEKSIKFSEKNHDRIIRALQRHPLPGNFRSLYLVAYHLMAARTGTEPLSPDDAIESSLASLAEQSEIGLSGGSYAQEVAGRFAASEPLDDLFEEATPLSTDTIIQEFRRYLAKEIWRVARNKKDTMSSLCDVSERTLRNWMGVQ